MSRKIAIRDALSDTKARHVLGLSGGKDSAALAIYIKDKYPSIHEKMEYFFSDTGSELLEVYDFLDKLEAYLGKGPARRRSCPPSCAPGAPTERCERPPHGSRSKGRISGRR